MPNQPPELHGLCVLLQVFDMPRSLAWYRDLLGFAVVAQSPGGDDCDWAQLRRGTAELMLNTRYERHERPSIAEPTALAAHADTALFIGVEVDSMYAYLLDRGLRSILLSNGITACGSSSSVTPIATCSVSRSRHAS